MKIDMFKFFNKKPKLETLIDSRSPAGTYKYQTGAELLVPHTKLINHIKRLSSASTGGFGLYYLPTIERFVETMQLLPVATEGPFSKLGGMVEKSLLLVIEALRVRQGYLLPVGSTAEEIARTKELWTYTIFVGALVHRCGQALFEMEMVFFNKSGKKKDERFWSGISEIDEEYCYYKIRKLDNSTKKLERYFPLVILRQWMGHETTSWMMSNNLAMDSLLSFMVGGSLDDKNSVSEIIQKANEHLMRVSLSKHQLTDVVEIDRTQTSNEKKLEEPAEIPPVTSETEPPQIESEPEYLEQEPALAPFYDEIEQTKTEGEGHWLDTPADQFMKLLATDINEEKVIAENVRVEGSRILVRYPHGFQPYTESPSKIRRQLNGTMYWLGEEQKWMGQTGRTVTLTLANR